MNQANKLQTAPATDAAEVDAPADQSPTSGKAAKKPRPDGFNWFRFWMQMLAAMVAFNIVAVVVTVYFIWPRLHPGH